MGSMKFFNYNLNQLTMRTVSSYFKDKSYSTLCKRFYHPAKFPVESVAHFLGFCTNFSACCDTTTTSVYLPIHSLF